MLENIPKLKYNRAYETNINKPGFDGRYQDIFRGE
jgi:hypothetical protein